MWPESPGGRFFSLALLSTDDLPKPQIITQPEPTVAIVGKDIRFTCSAASSSSSPMTFAWKKDNEALANADMENFAHVRAQDGKVMEYTTILHLRHVTFGHEGRYQCIITNHFGSTYSHKARLVVNGEAARFTLVCDPPEPHVVLCARAGRLQTRDTEPLRDITVSLVARGPQSKFCRLKGYSR